MAKNLFTHTKDKAGFYGFNPTGYVQSSLDNGAGQKDFSPTATNVIPADASKGKTVSLITPDTDGVDYLSQLLTTPEQEAEYRKDNINAQKIALIGDALRQVGNVITTSKGAVPQQFSASPVAGLAAEYKANKEKRDANNLRYYSAKQQERIAEAKNALAKMELENKQNWEKIKFQWEIQKAKQALAEAEAKRNATAEENEKRREFTAEQNKLNRENATKNAYIRSNGGSGKENYGYQTPYGRGTKAKDFTASQINQLFGYADANNLIQRSAIAAKLDELGLDKDAFEAKRQVVMDLLATNKDFADLVIANHDLKVYNPSTTPNITPVNTNTNTNTNNNANANANTSSGGTVLKKPVWQSDNKEIDTDENGKVDLRDLLGTKG